MDIKKENFFLPFAILAGKPLTRMVVGDGLAQNFTHLVPHFSFAAEFVRMQQLMSPAM